MSIEEIDDQIVPYIEKITGDGNVQTTKVAGSNDIIIKTRTLDKDEREEFANVMTEQFGVNEDSITAETISATVSSEMQRDAILSVVVSAFFMLLYIWFRFKDIRFAGSAVLALLHDVLVVARPIATQTKQQPVAEYLYKHTPEKPQYGNANTPAGVSLEKPYFEVSGCCPGCGEAPYYRLVSQLFGKDMLVANATGCSMIY